MPADEPGWWYASDDARARLLAPVARIWGRAAQARFDRAVPYKSRLPVICIGNFTAGGTGKTPVSLLVARLLAEAGETPAMLTRGYGGRIAGPAWLEPGRHTAREVGDEPLLLARAAPVMIARDRAAGARLVEASEPPGGARPASVIVMDDGLQNPALGKDLSIALVDGVRGVGNGRVMPAGPLRAPLEFQLGLVDAVIVMGGATAQATAAAGEAGGGDEQPAASQVLKSLRLSFPGPVLSGRQEPADDTAWLAGARVLAWAGIANPERFFALLRRLGADVAATVAFRDHHALAEQDGANLLARADELGVTLVTTEKDMARIAGLVDKRATGAVARLAAASRTLPIRVAFPDADAARLADLVRTAAETGGYRRGLRRR